MQALLKYCVDILFIVRLSLLGIIFLIYSILLNIFARLFEHFVFFPNFYQRLLRQWAVFLLFILKIKIQISPEDLQKFSCDQSQILLVNHNSHLDSIVLWGLVPEDIFLCFAAKLSLFKLPIYGKMLSSSGSIKINRENPKQSLQTLFNNFKNQKFAKSLVIYGEGTRNTTAENLLKFKNGTFLTAKKCQVRILPVVLYGTKEALPAKARIPKPARVIVKTLPEVSVANLLEQDMNQIKMDVWTKMNAVLQDIKETY